MNITTNLKKSTSFPSLVLVAALIIAGIFVIPQFFSGEFLTSFLVSNTPVILLAIAQTIVILGAGIDISVGAIISLVNVVMITMLEKQLGLPASILIGLLAGVGIGVLNGFVVGYLRITPFLATLATASVAQGLALTVTDHPTGSAPMEFVMWYQGIPATLLLILLGLIIWGIWKFTPLHLMLISTGNNFDKAYVSAVPARRIQFLSYVLSSLITGIAAVAITAGTGGGDPLIGSAFTLTSIAACVIGGVSLLGGKGSITGAILGAIFLGLAFTIVINLPFPYYFQQVTTALIVLIGIILSNLKRRAKNQLLNEREESNE